MAKHITSTGTTYDSKKGGGKSWLSYTPLWWAESFLTTHQDKTNSYGDFIYENSDMTSLSNKEIEKLIDETKKKGKPLNKQEILKITGNMFNADNKVAYYDYLVDQNAKQFGFTASGEKPLLDKDGNLVTNIEGTVQSDYGSNLLGPDIDTPNSSGLDAYQKYVDEMLMTDPNSAAAQQYRNTMYNSINAYEQTTNTTLAQAEIDAYKMLGQQQLQLENQIANERMQAIKSGTTSAQLASQQLANMFAAQSGAAQVAQSMMDTRTQNTMNFAQQRAAVESDLYSILNANQQTAGNIYAQLGAAQASYNSYIQQPYAQYQAMMQAYRQNPTNFEKAMGLNK